MAVNPGQCGHAVVGHSESKAMRSSKLKTMAVLAGVIASVSMILFPLNRLGPKPFRFAGR
jgi:hypothetical protein